MSDGASPAMRHVLDIANGIQGPNLAFGQHPEGGSIPAFPALRSKVAELRSNGIFEGTIMVTPRDTQEMETYFVDETGEYGPERPGV